jgi:hypothetical protein
LGFGSEQGRKKYAEEHGPLHQEFIFNEMVTD